jgi:hypothetical protein
MDEEMIKNALKTVIMVTLLAIAASAQTYAIEADCFGWVDETSRTLLSEAVRSDNNKLLNQLVIQGKLFLLNKGDLVTVTDMGFLSHTVYVLSGNYEGRTCIVATGSLGDRR